MLLKDLYREFKSPTVRPVPNSASDGAFLPVKSPRCECISKRADLDVAFTSETYRVSNPVGWDSVEVGVPRSSRDGSRHELGRGTRRFRRADICPSACTTARYGTGRGGQGRPVEPVMIPVPGTVEALPNDCVDERPSTIEWVNEIVNLETVPLEFDISPKLLRREDIGYQDS